QIKTAVRHLHKRLQQHQQVLSQLQDWVDHQQMPQKRSQMGDWQITPLRQSVPSAFQSESLGVSHYPQVSRPLPIGFDALELDQYSEPQLVIQSLLDDTVQLTEAADAIELFTRQSRQTQEQQGRLLLKTRDALIEGRMFPLGQLFERFPGVLQQLETLHHKPVELTLHGTEVLVDKAIGERLYDPILHLVRNAFDHGIEPVAVRQQWAKPKAGQLEIAAHHQGKHLVIEVRDDGQGLDFERIRQQAVERQLVSPQQAHNLSQAQLTDLLFEPGFSTTSQISSLSGRGVGLDVVRSQLQALQGEVTVTSVAHQGTTFTLHIPLSLTIAKLLLCQANARAYALLPDAIEQILIPQPDQIQQRDHCKVLWWGEDEAACWIPIYALSDLLDYHGQAQRLPTQSASPLMPKTSVPHILLIRHQGVLLGIEVAQMLGEQELVIRPLNPLLETHAYLYGASILADGRLTLVLDGAALAESASNLSVSNLQADSKTRYDSTHLSTETLAASTHPPRLPITTDLETGKQLGHKLLIVDDSVTTRQTLTLTLQKAGYQVIQAQDGQEAVDQLLQHPNVQLVICDIEMPRMNGFELLQHCQNDSALVKMPVMMLSSRSSEKHRFLAEQLGAIAYVSKPYLEHKLLSMVAEVLEAEVLNPISG
ncbi:MAG: response regulator, partial [Cyanobacteria bacterium J06659_2]